MQLSIGLRSTGGFLLIAGKALRIPKRNPAIDG